MYLCSHMKRFAIVFTLLLTICCCSDNQESGKMVATFTNDILLKHTPVKSQGQNQTCWAYAMLATIETNRLMLGDSVHLSVGYAVRNVIADGYQRYRLSKGAQQMTTRSTAQTLLNSIERHGIVPHSAYNGYENANTTVLCNKVRRIAQAAINKSSGLNSYNDMMQKVLNETLGAPPHSVYMFGAEYTPEEFSRSVCRPGSYAALTSFTHHPFYTHFALEVPDNWEGNMFYNVPIDTMMKRIDEAIVYGEAVCWEGDISEPGFRFRHGWARLPKNQCKDMSQDARQKMFESYQTTDDHAMCIIGKAHDKHGNIYYIMKNSWGTDNPYGGLMYVSANYIRMKTIAIWVKNEE